MEGRFHSTSNSVAGSRPGSGYSADSERTGLDSRSSEAPSSIDSLSRQGTRSLCSSNQQVTGEVHTLKRRDRSNPAAPVNHKRQAQKNEINYVAATAKHDILWAGLKLPPIQMTNPRLLPRDSGVQMSGVELVYSSTVSDTMFLAPEALFSSNKLLENPREISSLVQSCQHFYTMIPTHSTAALTTEGNKSDAASSTSSFTDTESTTSCDDGIFLNMVNPNEAENRNVTPTGTETRVVTQSMAPYSIVHFSGAFAKFTGFASVRVLGYSVEYFIRDNSFKEALKLCASNSAPAMLRLLKVRRRPAPQRSKYILCTVRISPIGPPSKPPTHLDVCIFPEEVQSQSVGLSNLDWKPCPILESFKPAAGDAIEGGARILG